MNVRVGLTPYEIQVLRWMCALPSATLPELAQKLAAPVSSIRHIGNRLLSNSVAQRCYFLNVDPAPARPIAYLLGRNRVGAEGVVLKGVPRLLKQHGISGVLTVEDDMFFGLLLPESLDRIPAFEADLLGLKAPGLREPAVTAADLYPFVPGSSTIRVLLDYVGLLDRLAGSRARGQLRGVASAQPGRAPAAARGLNRTEIAVAVELLTHPERRVAEAAAAAGLPRSTFAHVKSRLLSEGVIHRALRLNLPAIGFPYLLVTARHHRPIPSTTRHWEFIEQGIRGSSPVSYFLSPTHGVVLTPYPDLSAVRAAQRDFRALDTQLELLSKPYCLTFNLESIRRLGYAVPGDLAGHALRLFWQGRASAWEPPTR